jgi:hypothetical protein
VVLAAAHDPRASRIVFGDSEAVLAHERMFASPSSRRFRSEWAPRGSSSLEPAFGLSASQRPTDPTFTSRGFFCGPRPVRCGTAPRPSAVRCHGAAPNFTPTHSVTEPHRKCCAY